MYTHTNIVITSTPKSMTEIIVMTATYSLEYMLWVDSTTSDIVSLLRGSGSINCVSRNIVSDDTSTFLWKKEQHKQIPCYITPCWQTREIMLCTNFCFAFFFALLHIWNFLVLTRGNALFMIKKKKTHTLQQESIMIAHCRYVHAIIHTLLLNNSEIHDVPIYTYPNFLHTFKFTC